MANGAPPRDYLYVSTREVERLAVGLPRSAWERFTEPNEHGAGRGVGLSLAEAPPATVQAVAAEVESVLREQHRVRHVGDADLAVDHWFESPGLQMAYGVQAARRSEDSDAAVFVGHIGERSVGAESSLLLGGSAEYLQDRRPTTVEDVSGGMSYPSALFGLLASLSDHEVADPSVGSRVEGPKGDRRVPSHRLPRTRVEEAREEQWLAVGYPIAQAQSSFGRRGLFPLGFLARAVKVVDFESHGVSGRWIVGTPLGCAAGARVAAQKVVGSWDGGDRTQLCRRWAEDANSVRPLLPWWLRNVAAMPWAPIRRRWHVRSPCRRRR